MTKKETQTVAGQMWDVYRGILFQNQTFAPGEPREITYEWDRPEFAQLRQRYDLQKIAGGGSDFAKAKRLMHALAPRLTHSPWYDNHVACNALDLLDYSLDNPQQGINCRNKAKILQECAMALGIYARRVTIMPFSPYDFDNHVVTEIYDRTGESWIALDLTTDGYFVDENRVPLSLLELRHRFANDKFATFVRATDALKDLERLRQKYAQINAYICKNLFYFRMERRSTIGETGELLYFIPTHYRVKESRIANQRFRLDHITPESERFRGVWEEMMRQAEESEEPVRTDIRAMAQGPV